MGSETVQDEMPREIAGVLAEFSGPEALVEAAAQVRDAGYSRFDAHSPFPVHGIDPAMGIRRTRLPWIVLGAGITGAVVALVMQWWTNAVDYPILISGKPMFSLPANIPVTFELIVLFSALAAFGGVFALCRLPEFTPAVFSSEKFRTATTHGFFLSIDARDPKFEEGASSELLRGAGAASVETYGWPDTKGAKIPTVFYWAGALAVLVAILPPLYVAKIKLSTSDKPRIHLVPDMDHQPRYNTQAASGFFADGRTMRGPVPGTVALGGLTEDEHFFQGTMGGEPATTFPSDFEISEAAMLRGQERFDIFCAPCHGIVGSGDGLVSKRAMARADSTTWNPVSSLHVAANRRQPVGQIFQAITNGVRTMPAYESQISPEDRWAVILYVRALQRSQNASFDDVPDDMQQRLKAKLQ